MDIPESHFDTMSQISSHPESNKNTSSGPKVGDIPGTKQRSNAKTIENGLLTLLSPKENNHREAITPDEEIGSLSSHATMKFEQCVLEKHQMRLQEIQKAREEADEKERQRHRILEKEKREKEKHIDKLNASKSEIVKKMKK